MSRSGPSGRGEKPFPVEFDPSSRVGFTDQLVEGLRRLIDEGFYRTGDRLPTWKEMSDALGCSTRVPRDALRRLAAEGYVLARRRLGSVVQKPSGKRGWKGTVLCIAYRDDWQSYHLTSFFASFRRTLARCGYVAVPLEVNRNRSGAFDFSAASSLLDRKADFAVVLCNNLSVGRWFSGFGIPFLGYGGHVFQNLPNCRGSTSVGSSDRAYAEFVRHCRRANIRHVLQIGFCAGSTVDVAGELKKAGIDCESWQIPPLTGMSRREGIREAARHAVAARFSGKGRLPDLVFFTDDVVAAGGLFGLVQTGLRIPEDIRVATFQNEGDCPLSPCPLTVMLNQPAERGRRIARQVIAQLSPDGGVVEKPFEFLTYRIAESFPDK